MAGSDTGFDATEFRDAIHFAMLMGSPNQIADKATFKWTKVQTFNPQDPAHHPYRWNETVLTDTTHADVTLDEVAVEYRAARTESGTDVGTFNALKAVMTMLDEDYVLVEGATEVTLGPATWNIITITQEALFGVDVYSLHVERQ
jgi:hypothetical protein